MQTIDLKRILKTANLKPSFVGAHLFPNSAYPDNAIRRIIRGEMLLNSEQIAKLSDLLNVPIGLLFDEAEWKMGVEAERKNIIHFRAYDYYAELDTSTMKTTVSRSGMLFFETLTHERGVTLTDYLSQLTDLIIKYK